MLDPKEVRLFANSHGQLMVQIGDQEPVAVKATRAFPLTYPDRYIGLANEDGKEVGMIDKIASLPREMQDLLDEALERGFFVPQIVRVENVSEEFGVTRWEVTTDKGPRVFEVRGREDIRFLTNRHIIIRDIDGNRFEIKDLSALDAESQGK
ncbi:MAG: DUF1854 domain-containing protein, partial [Armatimonadetes bacterium]|nr:DUF1854 domain-containing protein [Armatimonadota bacterium]